MHQVFLYQKDEWMQALQLPDSGCAPAGSLTASLLQLPALLQPQHGSAGSHARLDENIMQLQTPHKDYISIELVLSQLHSSWQVLQRLDPPSAMHSAETLNTPRYLGWACYIMQHLVGVLIGWCILQHQAAILDNVAAFGNWTGETALTAAAWWAKWIGLCATYA